MLKIINVISMSAHKLQLKYDSNETKIFDVSPYIQGSWFGLLSDEEYFKTVHIINGGRGIEWKDGQDIAPHELYELSV